VSELRQIFPLAALLKAAGLPRSTFYYRLSARACTTRRNGLKEDIQRVYREHKGRYGYRRITAAIRKAGTLVNHKAVQALMQQMQLRSIARTRKFRYHSGTEGKVAPNTLDRQFNASRPNSKWVTDVTEFHLEGQKLYLSPIVDLFNGEVVAYETSQRPTFRMVSMMLKAAFARLSDGDKPLLHSDQGSLYRMSVFQRVLAKQGLRLSMSRRGNCYDNAPMESFFGALKAEFFHTQRFESIEQLKSGIAEYIAYYNRDRIKLRLNGMSPIEYRLTYAASHVV
jgi:putative transposase